MRTTFLFIFFSMILFTSCKKQGEISPDIKTDSFHADSILKKYLISQEQHAEANPVGGPGGASGFMSYFLYDNTGRVIRRTGGVISGFTASYYTPLIYDTLVYAGSNTVTLSTGVIPNPDFTLLYPHIRVISFTGGLVTKKITYYYDGNYGNDTIYYYYDGAKKLEHTEQFNHNYSQINQYAYNSSGNLTKITGSYTYRRTNYLTSTTEEFFSGYDNTANPLKGPVLWEDLLYRSLSSNNFNTYEYIEKDAAGIEDWHEYIHIPLGYDINGHVNFAK
ncbi:MAG: hypothetical protein ABIP30_10515 [Ferruginibacter sp.]